MLLLLYDVYCCGLGGGKYPRQRLHECGRRSSGSSSSSSSSGSIVMMVISEKCVLSWARRKRSAGVPKQHASVSQGRICSDKFTCCHTEIEVADPTFHLTQSQYTDTVPTSPSAYPITPGAWQDRHWSANFKVTGMTGPRKKSRRKRDSNLGSSVLEADALKTRPTMRYRRQRLHRTGVKVAAVVSHSPFCCGPGAGGQPVHRDCMDVEVIVVEIVYIE